MENIEEKGEAHLFPIKISSDTEALTLTHLRMILTHLQQMNFENIVAKEEIAHNE